MHTFYIHVKWHQPIQLYDRLYYSRLNNGFVPGGGRDGGGPTGTKISPGGGADNGGVRADGEVKLYIL